MISGSADYRHIFDMLSDAITVDEVKRACDLFSESVGFEYYLFGICSATSLSSPEISTVSNYPMSWVKTYFDEKFQRDDPVVRYCFNQIAPIRWDYLLKMDDYCSPMGELILKRAAECGLSYGMSIPRKSHTGEISIYSLATGDATDIDARFTNVLPEAQAFSIELLNTVSRINLVGKVEEKESLTQREIECMFWACEGKTTWEISKIINISERTVIFHLTGATKKLGAVNRQHAVAKAITSGLIKPKL